MGGAQFAKLQNLKFHNFRSTQAIDLKFSPDLAYYIAFQCLGFGGCSSTVADFIIKRPPKKESYKSGTKSKVNILIFFHHLVNHLQMMQPNNFHKIGPAKP